MYPIIEFLLMIEFINQSVCNLLVRSRSQIQNYLISSLGELSEAFFLRPGSSAIWTSFRFVGWCIGESFIDNGEASPRTFCWLSLLFRSVHFQNIFFFYKGRHFIFSHLFPLKKMIEVEVLKARLELTCVTVPPLVFERQRKRRVFWYQEKLGIPDMPGIILNLACGRRLSRNCMGDNRSFRYV